MRIVAVDTGVAESPSTGDAPRAPPILDRSSPSTSATVEGSSSLVHPPNLHETRILLCTLEAKGRYSRHLEKTSEFWTRTPVQGVHQGSPTSIGSPSASEQATNGTRKNQRVPYSMMAPPPPSSRPRRDTNPRSTGTTSERRVTRGLHRLAKPRGPSEARPSPPAETEAHFSAALNC